MASSAIVGILRALLTADTASFDSAMKRSGESAKVLSRDLRQVGQQMTQVGSALTKTLTLPLVALGVGAAKAAMDFESSFANVRKTVDASEKDLDRLAKTFREMAKEIPATTDELNKIAALGGQMGVPIDQLAHFTRNVAALGVAVDGINTDDAAAGLAQIGNATGTGTTKIAEMASALVHLGNKSNATEADILEFTKRLVGAGHTVGMTVPEVMALGTAMANVGINAEAGGTAMSTVISKISKAVSEGGNSLREFAEVANLSADEFAATWQRSPIQAIDAFVKGLASMRARGVDLNMTMGEIGTEGIRVADTLKRLAGAGDGVSKSLVIANEGFSQGNKHLEEAEKKYKTTANQLKLLWNQITDVGITIGNALLPAITSAINLVKVLIPVIDLMAKGFAALPGGIQLAIIGVAGLVAAIGPLLFAAGQVITTLATVIGAFAKKGIAARALQTANDALAASNVRLGASFRAVLPFIGAVTAALAGLAVASLIQSKAAKQYTDQFKELADIEAEIAKREAEIARLRQDPDARREMAVVKEHLEALKVKRDVLKQIADEQARANAAGAAAQEGFAFQGPMPQGKVLQKTFADEITRANKQIQDEIKNTGLSVGQLTKMLAENEVAFKAGAKAMGLNAETVQFLEQQLQKGKKATQETKKATDDLTKSTEQQTKALESLGIVTRESVTEQFKELNELWSFAVAKGVPLETIVKALGPAYQKLADKAKESNVELKELNETLALQAKLLPAIPIFSVPVTLGVPASMIAGMKTFSTETMDATRKTIILGNAFEGLGLKTKAELERTARDMRQHYNDLLAAGLLNEKDRKASLERVLEAERAAAGETVSIWKTQIFPGIKGVVENLITAVNGSFAQMLIGAKGFKDGFVDIWQSIKASILNVFNQILSAFVNQFLKGLLGALAGQSGAWSQAFKGLMGGSGGGFNWAGMARNALGVGGAAAAGGTTVAATGLTASAVNAGGGFSGSFGTAAGAGLSTTAIVATGGIAAAVIAAWAIYNNNKNDTKKVREAFAEALGFKDLSKLYTQLATMGTRGQELQNIGQNVIGKKDQAANKKWMEDVERFMHAVENFTSTVSSATGSIAAGFTGKLSGVFERQTKDQLKAYDDQVKAAQEHADKLLENEDLTADERKAINEELSARLKQIETERVKFVKDANAAIVANTQEEFDRISRITLGSYTAARAQGQSAVQAVQTVGPAIDALKASADQFGFAGNAAFETLLRWRELTAANAPLLDSITGITDLMQVMADTGHLDKQMFADLQAQGLATYQSLIDAGFTEAEARAAIKPMIEEEIRLAKEKGFEIDKGTAAIYKTMIANGELAEDEKSLIDVFKEGFGALLKFLKVDLPAGWGDTSEAGKKAAKDTKDEWDNTARGAENAAEDTRRAWGGLRFTVPVDFEAGEFPSPPSGSGGSFPRLPGLASGGIVTRPSFWGIGEAGPEAVIPLNRLNEMLGNANQPGGLAGGVQNHYHITNNISAIDGPSIQRLVESRDFAEANERAIVLNTNGLGTAIRRVSR